MDDKIDQQLSMQMDIKPEVAGGQYSNLVLISHSHSDFIVDFAKILPGMPKAEVCSRIILAPEHAKRLLLALQENLYRYEQEYGKIEIPVPNPHPGSPFGQGEGEA